MARQRALDNRHDPVPVDIAGHLDHQIVGEAGDRAMIGDVHRPDLLAIVEHGIDHVDRQLELVDATARPAWVQHRHIGGGLLAIVLPVVGHRGHDVLRAGRRFGLQLGQHLVLEIIIQKIRRWDGAHRRSELEQAQIVDAGGRVALLALVGRAYQWHHVRAIVLMAHTPRAVIEPDHHRVDFLGVEVGGLRQHPREDDRPLAQRDGGDGTVVGDRLGDDIDRVGVVEQACLRADRLHIGDDPLHHVDRTQRHEEPAGALRLLADHAIFEWDALVEMPRLEAAGPKTRQHRVAVRQAGAPVGGDGDRQIDPFVARHFVRQGLDNPQPLEVEVDQDHLRALEVLALRDQRCHGAGGTGAAPADVCQLDACHRRCLTLE